MEMVVMEISLKLFQHVPFESGRAVNLAAVSGGLAQVPSPKRNAIVSIHGIVLGKTIVFTYLRKLRI